MKPTKATPSEIKTKSSVLFDKKVPAKADGMRVDLFLRGEHPEWSRKKIKTFLDNHQVAVNRSLVYVASWTLKAGDTVVVHPSKFEREVFLKVLYEDGVLIAIDKAPYTTFDELIGQIKLYLKRKSGPNFHPYVFPLHRLDRDTSGVFIAATDPRGKALIEQFKTHALRKTYVAVVDGQVPFSERRLSSHLVKGEFGGGKKVEVSSRKNIEGKASQTDMRILERYAKASFLELVPKTGRTHQIRAHLSEIGYPIVGDRVYGGTVGKSRLSFPRQALHAHKLQFKHPASGAKISLTAPIPRDMQGLIDRLRG